MWALLLAAFLAQSTDYVADGLKALDNHQQAAAIDLFNKAVAANANDGSAHFYLALAYSEDGKDAQAIPEYKRVLEIRPKLFEAEINLGMSLLNIRDGASAVAYLKDAAAQKPQEFRPVYLLGEALLQSDQPAAAATALTMAVSLDPKAAPAELSLGHALARQDKLHDAEPHFRKATQLDPMNRDSLLELAKLYDQQHDAPAALNLYREFPDIPAAQERAGLMLLDSGEIKSAIAALEFAVAKAPTPNNRAALAQAFVKDKQLDKAEALAAQAVAATPNDLDLRMFYGRILRDERKFPLASQQFAAVGNAKPDSVEAWRELAGVLVVAEQYNPALDALERLRKLGADTAGSYFLRAVSFDRLRQTMLALDEYGKFLASGDSKTAEQEFQARERIKALEFQLGKR